MRCARTADRLRQRASDSGDALGWIPAGQDMRYDATPPELFPFAATGCDGGHFGYVIHAPELPATDYPVRRFELSEHDDGVYLVGTTTFEAAETELSFQMQCDQEFGLFRSPFSSEWWPEVAARLRGLGIEPNLAKAERNFENGNGKPVTPIVIPQGWRHVSSRDSIGVLAPAPLFYPAPLPAIERRPDVSAVVGAALRYAAGPRHCAVAAAGVLLAGLVGPGLYRALPRHDRCVSHAGSPSRRS
jgi:hypothetical protein